MSFFSGLGSAISSGLSTVCSAVSSACSVIGRGVSSFAANVVPKLLTVVGNVGSQLSAVVRVVEAVATIWKIVNPGEKVEDIGDRAIQAGEKKEIAVENYDSFEAYMEALRDFDIDPAKSEKIDDTTKKIAGMGVITHGLAEALGASIQDVGKVWLLSALKGDYFTPGRIDNILKTTSDIGAVMDYFDKQIIGSEALAVEKELVSAEKQLNPDKDETQIYAEVDKIRDDLAQASKQFQ